MRPTATRAGRLRSAFILGLAALLAVSRAIIQAGPPFITDDPEPVDLDHWEIFLATQDQRTAAGWTGTSPHVENNYGAFPDVQLQCQIPIAFDRPVSGPSQVGLGDLEVAVKWRFIHETDSCPQLAIYPGVTFPTGDHQRGLGEGHGQVFLPLWMQKTLGAWCSFGGAGYWINPGAGNRNYWYMGLALLRQLTDGLAIGGELFHTTPNAIGASSSSGFTLGAIYDLTEHLHLMASAGRDFTGPDLFLGYAAIQLTF